MESWTRVVIEWINCLGIAQPSVQDVHDLRDCLLYHKLISQLRPVNSEASTTTTRPLDERELVSEFIKAEYPEFVMTEECATGISDELYIASLLLTQCSQKAAFHRPMCVNLKHETQVYIKKFLEMVLPYGKSITKEIIGVAIMEIGDATPNTPPSTPIVRPLREFFNSPAARSVHSQRFINDRNRELRRLKAQLETEQFEKADLVEDIRIQEEKIQNLQKKLQEKSQEMKALRNERLKPPTPQSCRKNNRPSDNEERYKRELEQSENANLGLQSEMEKLQDEREELARRLTSKDRLHFALKEKFDQYERSMEALSIQLEMKNNELLGLRMNNEELREHIREIQRSTLGEQSFEMEPISRARSPLLLNSSEALSSIIDIQLQEAKEESAQLKNQLDGVNERLEIALRECQDIKRLNAVFQEKTTELDVSLRSTQERLDSSTKRVNNLELENSELMENLAKLDSALASEKKLLSLAENRRDAYESELADATSRIQNLEASLEKEKCRSAELESTVCRVEDECKDLHTRLASTVDKLNRLNENKTALEFDLQEKVVKLGESNVALMNEKSRVTELESTAAGAKKECRHLEILLGTSEENLSRVTEEIRKLEFELRERMKNLEESENCLVREKKRVAELESTVARAKRENEDLQSLLSSSDETLSRVNEDKKTLEFNLEESKKRLVESETRLYNEKSTVAELESILTRTNKESESLKERLTLSEGELFNVKKNNKSLELNLEENKKRLEGSEASLKKERTLVAELESTISRLQKDSDGLRDELRSNKESLGIEQARITELESIVARGKKDTQELQDMLVESRTWLETEKSGSAELRTLLCRSKNTCQELESALRTKEDLLKESLERASSLNAQLDTCRLRTNDLELSLRSESLRSAEFESECSRGKENCARLEAELASKERVLADTEMSKTSAETELHKINAEMHGIEMELVNLREELSRVKEKNRESLLANEKIERYARDADERIVSLEAKIDEYERRIDEASTKERHNLKILQAELIDKSSTIDELVLRLEETEKRESTTAVAVEEAKKKIAELTELGEEVESQLAQEREQLSAIRADKQSLNDELTSYVSSEANLKEKIIKIVEELKDSNESLQKQIDTNAMLKKNLLEVQDAKHQLENKLAQEQRQSAVILTEKYHLEQELASSVNSAANMKERIENDLEECNRQLQAQLEATAVLKKDNIELTKLRGKVENKVAELQEQSTVYQTERHALQEELSLYVRSTGDMKEKIAKMEKYIEASDRNQEEQHDVIEALGEKVRELEKLREKLEKELSDERARLTELRNEKEMLEEEASLYGRSNQDLGNKIIALQAKIEANCNDLQKERESNATLRKIELKDAREKLNNELAQVREQLAAVGTEKKSLEVELSAYARSKADMNEEISALHKELEGYRKDLQQLQQINEKLEEKVREADARIESLQGYESRSEQLYCDLEIAKRECSTSRERITELAEELEMRVKEITRAESQLCEVKRENYFLTAGLEEQVETSNYLAASLKKELMSSEKLCADAKLEEKLKEDALRVVGVKLEELTREKIESELRMKEVILNLKEVRSSQDGVLEAQVRTLNEKSRQLERAEKELVDLKNSLTAKTGEIEREKLALREVKVQCEKFQEHNQVQSNLVKELQIALKIEQSQVEESGKRCRALENNVKEIARVLKLELNAMWDSISKSCPEMFQQRQFVEDSQEDVDNSEIQRLSLIVRSFTDDAKTIYRAVSMLSEANDKLKNNMKEIVQVSGSLKLELSALWDSVRRACPELARTKNVISSGLEDSPNNPEISEISYAVKSFADDAKAIRKAVSILSEANETLKEHLDGEKEIAKTWSKEAERRKLELDERITSMENERKKRDRYLSLIVERKKNFQELLSMAVSKRDQVDKQLGALTDRWRKTAEEAQSVLTAESSACDELKHLQAKRTELDNTLSNINNRQARSLKPLLEAVCRIFAWSEAKLDDLCVLVESELSPELSEEQKLVESEINKCEQLQQDLSAVNEKIETFSNLLESYEASLKSGAIKRAASSEEKLQSQVDKLSKERKEMKDKLDAMRLRNAKMEKNMNDMRNENKKLKTEVSSADSTEHERFQRLIESLEKQVSQLQQDNEKLTSKKSSDEQDFETRLKQVHDEYGQKLEKIKQKMKSAYNEQIAKLNQDKEKALKDKMDGFRVQMEKQCRKYTEDIAKYKAHISDLSSRYWDVGEKLLAETQEKQTALRQLEQLRGSQEKHEAIAEINQQTSVTQNRQKTASLDRRDFVGDGKTRPGYRAVQVIEEETTTYSTRRHSVKSIQAMGNAFNAEDEESEIFDSVYLTDLKEGRCAPVGPDFDRLSELRMRNSMCRPHLKSSYAVETHFQPITLNEDDIKNGITADDVFNDSLSQSLLPGQKPKKKDRTQTSYKRPGPPTPSKNGGRLSLQGNELKSPSSRVLRERNVERRTTATPRGLKNLFGTSISKRQDENATGTPKGRRLSNIFRKQRTERN